ncbi:hypothetical protein [Scytonema sp. NUACC26]
MPSRRSSGFGTASIRINSRSAQVCRSRLQPAAARTRSLVKVQRHT